MEREFTKQDIKDRISELGFDKNEFWVSTGAALVMYGLRRVAHNIDMGCSKKLFEKLVAEGHQTVLLADDDRIIRIDDDVEVHEKWEKGEVIIIEDVPVLSLQGIVKTKRYMSRAKDFQDIAMIEMFLDGMNK